MDTHIFVTTGNNSGSTILVNLLSWCKNVVTFPRNSHEEVWTIAEGQHVAQGHMPDFKLSNIGLVWTENLDRIQNNGNYNWDLIKKAWDVEWRKHENYHNLNRVLVEKSPHNIGRVDILSDAFPNSWFLIQVRNPYVVAEGVRRRMGSGCDIRRAGNHVFKMLQLCRENLEQHNQILAWRYEDLFEKPHIIQKMITDSIQDISDFNFDLQIPSKTLDGYIHMNLTNMNDRQLDNLSSKDIKILNSIFDSYKSTMKLFNYERM